MRRLVLTALLLAILTGCSGAINQFPDNAQQPSYLKDLNSYGVMEAREKCDDTLKGAILDNFGCSSVKELDERITVNLLFNNGYAYVDPKDTQKWDYA